MQENKKAEVLCAELHRSAQSHRVLETKDTLI